MSDNEPVLLFKKHPKHKKTWVMKLETVKIIYEIRNEEPGIQVTIKYFHEEVKERKQSVYQAFSSTSKIEALQGAARGFIHIKRKDPNYPMVYEMIKNNQVEFE